MCIFNKYNNFYEQNLPHRDLVYLFSANILFSFYKGDLGFCFLERYILFMKIKCMQTVIELKAL